jgi:hypothetical protein
MDERFALALLRVNAEAMNTFLEHFAQQLAPRPRGARSGLGQPA